MVDIVAGAAVATPNKWGTTVWAGKVFKKLLGSFDLRCKFLNLLACNKKFVFSFSDLFLRCVLVFRKALKLCF
jgi:hypothetical protein